MKIKALSWSELSTWQRDKNDHYKQYVLGEKFVPNRAMTLGSIIHGAIERETQILAKAKSPSQFNWMEEMKQEHFTRKEMVNVRKILNALAPKFPPQSEVYVKVETSTGIPLVGIFDGLDKASRELHEYKTTNNDYVWNQYKVDRHGQLAFYAYMWQLQRHEYFREMYLHRINTEAGRVLTYKTIRGPMDILHIANQIETAALYMKQQGIWDKRISSKKPTRQQTLI